MDSKEIESLKKAQAWQSVTSSYNWYSWDSPIGLSIFILIMTVATIAIAIAVKWLWLMK